MSSHVHDSTQDDSDVQMETVEPKTFDCTSKLPSSNVQRKKLEPIRKSIGSISNSSPLKRRSRSALSHNNLLESRSPDDASTSSDIEVPEHVLRRIMSEEIQGKAKPFQPFLSQKRGKFHDMDRSPRGIEPESLLSSKCRTGTEDFLDESENEGSYTSSEYSEDSPATTEDDIDISRLPQIRNRKSFGYGGGFSFNTQYRPSFGGQTANHRASKASQKGESLRELSLQKEASISRGEKEQIDALFQMRARRSKEKKALSRQEIIRNIYNETIEMVNEQDKEKLASPRFAQPGASRISSGWGSDGYSSDGRESVRSEKVNDGNFFSHLPFFLRSVIKLKQSLKRAGQRASTSVKKVSLFHPTYQTNRISPHQATKEKLQSHFQGSSESSDDEIERTLKPRSFVRLMQKGELSDTVNYVLDPQGLFIQRWRLLVSPLIMFNSVNVPYRIAYGFDGTIGFFFYFSYFSDLVLFLDLIIHFRTGYYDGGILITDTKLIRQKYLSSSFAIDVVASIPFDFIQIPMRRVFPAARLNKILRISQLFRFLDELEQRPGANITQLRFISLIASAFLFVHISACCWFVIGSLEGFGINDWVPGEELAARSQMYQYQSSVYWVLSILAGQSPVSSAVTFAEHVFTFIVVVIGTLDFAYIVGSVGAVIDSHKENLRKHEAKVNYAMRFMKNAQVPKQIQQKVLNYYDFLWTTHRGFASDEILSGLPSRLKHDCTYYVFQHLVQKVSFLKHFDINSTKELIDRMRRRIYIPGELLYPPNTICDRIYIISYGSFKAGDRATRKLLPGSYGTGHVFGEHELFMGTKMEGSVVAASFAEVLVLERCDFQEVMTLYPRDLARMQLHAARKFIRKTIPTQEKPRTTRTISIVSVPSDIDGEVNHPHNRFHRLSDPLSRESVVFDFVVLVAILCNLIWIPFAIAFCDTSIVMSGTITSIMFDVVYLADIYVRQHRGYMTAGRLVTKPELIKSYYKRHSLKWDIVTMLPLQYIGLIASGEFKAIFRIPSMVSFIRLNKVIDSSVGVVLSESPLKALKLTAWFMLMLHWIGCWYYSFTKSDGFGGPFLPSENANFGTKYLRAIIVALKVIAWKGPSNFPQTLRHLWFTNACVLAGLFISAYIIGSIASLISNFDVLKTNFNNKTVQMNSFMITNDIPSLLRRRVQRFHNYIYGDSKGTELNEVIADLPMALRVEMLMYLFAEPIRAALGPYFAETLGDGFIQKLLMLVSMEKIPAKEFVMLKNEMSTQIFFIVEGEVEILKSVEGQAIATFGAGNLFGERCILGKSQRKCNAYVRSKYSSKFLVLDHIAAQELSSEYFIFYEMLEQISRKRRKRRQTESGSETQEDDEATAHFSNDSRGEKANKRSLQSDIHPPWTRARSKVAPI